MRFTLKTLELNQILDRVATYAKTDTVRSWIAKTEPKTDLDDISNDLIETDAMLQLIRRLSLFPLLSDFDIDGLLDIAKLDRILSITELQQIRLFLSMEKDVFNHLAEVSHLKLDTTYLNRYLNQLTSHHDLLQYFNQVLDPDGGIYDDATPELYVIRKNIIKGQKSLDEKMQKLLVEYQNHLNELVIVQRNNRYCLAVKDSSKNKIKGVVHDLSASKQTVYIEPEQTRSITAAIETLQIEEVNEISRIIALLSHQIYLVQATLKQNLDQFLVLDLLSAKARYAKDIDGVVPKLNMDGRTKLIQARHPLLDPKQVVPIDLELNDDHQIILITGPNTGGKTVALKTVGLLTLMMQSGLLIPASSASDLSIYDQVFADIGDEQSIAQSLSTFSSHLTKIVEMLAHLSDRTLILLDELGSGTDPNEGVSLAIAIIEAFREKKIRMMVTTHYSELKSYAYEHAHIQTASVAFDKKTLKPLYYLQMGTTGSSHAFLIAKRLGLKDEILEHAHTLYQGRQTDLAKIMEKLTDEMHAVDLKKSVLAKEITALEMEKQSYQKQRKELIQQQDASLEKLKAKEQTRLDALKRELQQLIAELSSKNELSTPELAAYKHQVKRLGVDAKPVDANDVLSIGDTVFIPSYQQYGKITGQKQDVILVLVGQFELSFKKEDLRKDQAPELVKTAVKPKVKPKNAPTDPIKKEAKLELDLRGFRYEEVHDALDQAIDRAILSGLSSLRIIHGFGVGAVRKAVHAYLKNSPYVKSQRYGGEGEGLNGVTIVTLK